MAKQTQIIIGIIILIFILMFIPKFNLNVTKLFTVSCSPNWQIGSWSSCVDGKQTRTVTDLNKCQITNTEPPNHKLCDSSRGDYGS